MNMQPATLEHSTGRPVPGFADRDAYDAGSIYVDVQFDATSRPTGVHRSKVMAFDKPHDPRVKRTKTWRMIVENRTSGRMIRHEYVEAETFYEAIDAVRVKLNAFEACSGGLLAGTSIY